MVIRWSKNLLMTTKMKLQRLCDYRIFQEEPIRIVSLVRAYTRK